ncbi:MAG: hypothetical protein A3B23_04050 [Candidatus Colwellbacteria bacterium RIFCSPLOWO2_01_FULL_48_10]|uniref:Thioredoxin domain-containing protein n=2 Tax=Bacteria candidate phyla TaxID=1783234 RepID=A0A1F5P258_9BACT|nr:MAG: hypothetical protein A2846_04200 [Candidatus Doudnabacteria bacterium RIFCSPHIGHO2_01_FULL_49_9]OGY59336.1 MAG: hypothetical protein A3B23_04050 [Candidatus Colwellbacteria bacterium RIFCSPLOWO2_01_FULL_48_10]
MENEISSTQEIQKQSATPAMEPPVAPASASQGLNKNMLVIALAIIVAGGLIGAGLMFSGGREAKGPSPEDAQPVIKSDHIRGDLKAPVQIIEFSDTECPYCKVFHKTMNRIFAEYGESGRVVWAYRHFPLTNIHPKAPKEAEATECAAELGGNVKFWEYLDRLFEVTPSNNGLDAVELPAISKYVGLDVALFNTCLASGKYKEKVNNMADEAISAGAEGTPYSIVISRDGDRYPISGALPYETVKQIIEKALE